VKDAEATVKRRRIREQRCPTPKKASRGTDKPLKIARHQGNLEQKTELKTSQEHEVIPGQYTYKRYRKPGDKAASYR